MKDHYLQLYLAKIELLEVPAQFHHPVRHINHNSFKNRQKPWSNVWWSADFLRPHCLKCPVLQICFIQHQEYQALSFWTCFTAPYKSSCSVQPGLMQFSEPRFIMSSQRDTKSLSQTFTLNVPSWRNDLPVSIPAAESKNRLKTHLFHLYLTPSLAITIPILFYSILAIYIPITFYYIIF